MARVSDKAPTVPPIVPPQKPGACRAVDAYNWDVQIAYAICMAESGGNPRAYNINTNGSNDAGIMQINSIHSDLIALSDRYDVTKNVAAAYRIYRGSGWTAWAAYNNQSYKKHLSDFQKWANRIRLDGKT